MNVFRRREGDEGAAAVEMALVLPILVLFLFAIIEFGFAYNRYQGMQAAAREGGRVAAVGGDQAAVEERVWQTAPPLIWDAENHLEVIVVGDCPADDTIEVTVRVRASETGRYAIRIPLVPGAEPNFESMALFRCE